jgi:N6-L-threonylcarbamoyladenine synthase
MNKIILGIETSCDDTSICLLKSTSARPEILTHHTYSQDLLLKKWGGVVPELAARNHLDKITKLLAISFNEAGITLQDVDLIGVTTLPGLLGPLLTGLNAAKTCALIAKKPIFAVNHLYAHLEAIHLTEDVSYPYLGLLVSGGHSLYMLVNSSADFVILGSTIDDAAGEAFDKGGKLLGLGYPAGKIIDDLAKWGNSQKNLFAIGLQKSGDARLSFSGLKTSLRRLLEENPKYHSLVPSQFQSKEDDKQEFYDLCASYQQCIVDALNLKLSYAYQMALSKTNLTSMPIVVGGGVACNSALRKTLTHNYPQTLFVEPKFCTDNGAMIANYALKNEKNRVNYPDCLSLDSRGRFIDKKEFRT